MLRKINIKSKLKDYSVEFVSSIDAIISLTKEPNTLVYIDDNISQLYPELQNYQWNKIKCIEQNKNLNYAQNIFSSLVKNKANAKTKIVAIGGGILQDLVGFCCSVFCRGLDYTLIPTTLLSQADSCIGGKTSINLENKKNILGTFYPPTHIMIYENFLKTLSNLDLLSGFGEIYKFNILQNKHIPIFSSTTKFMPLIQESLRYKANILDIDEFDKNERKFLNFGHTFGHSLESSSEYSIPHGIAVIIGCMIAINLSKKYNYTIGLYNDYIDSGLSLLKQTKITFKKEWFDFDKLIHIAKSDKKNTGVLNMVLINNKPIIQPINDLNELKTSIREIYESI